MVPICTALPQYFVGDMSGPDILAFAQELEVHHTVALVIAKQIIAIAMIGQRNPQNGPSTAHCDQAWIRKIRHRLALWSQFCCMLT